MQARKIRFPLVLLMFAAMPVGSALAQETQASASKGSLGAAAVESSPIQPPTLPAGTVITGYVTETLSSRHNRVGEPVRARVAHSVVSARGESVVPRDAVLHGVISQIAAEDEGGIVLTFHSVEFGGNLYLMQARVISLPTRKQRRGNAAGDAAKVGAGAVVGGIAGRIIGGNSKGTIVGALSGALAGGGVAAATRKDDVVVDGGTPVQLQLTAPFSL